MKMPLSRFGLAAAIACGAVFYAHAQEGAPAVSTKSGVFTKAQVEEGMQVYRVNCSEGCHLYHLDGYGKAKPLVGEPFKERWRGKNLAELYELISVKMPQDFPATLTPEEYVNVTAYVLSENGFPAGATALTGDPAALARIVFADE